MLSLDPQKIQNKISQLNHISRVLVRESAADVWQEVQGFYAATTVTVDGNDSLTFHPSQGLILKMFVNSQTGELKFFPAKMFE